MLLVYLALWFSSIESSLSSRVLTLRPVAECSFATNFLRCRTCCNIFDWYDTCWWSWTFDLLCKILSFLSKYLTLSYTQALQTSVDTKFVVHQRSEAFELVWNLSLPAFRVYLYRPVSSLASSGAVCYSCSVQKKSHELFEEIWALPKTHLVKVITTLRVVTEKNT